MDLEQLDIDDALRDAVELAVDLLDAKDPYGRCHATGVATLSLLLGESLGLEQARLRELWLAAMLHDVGKLAIPDAVVAKPGRLTPEEYEQAKAHATESCKLLARQQRFETLLEIVAHHHEHWDGGGYPDGLAGEQIPLAARIICVADAFDAMTTDRSYRRRLSHEDACEEINRLAGSQFCPAVVEHLNRIRPRIPDLTVAAAEVLAQQTATDVTDLPRAEASTTTLDRLEPGDRAQVAHVGGQPELRRRLLELGLVPGAPVELVRVAPLGDPLEVRLRGADFTLRKADACLIQVRRAQQDEDEAPSTRALVAHPASRRYQVAVVGSPNTGKTTLFNALTGASGQVGNYPGITVERLTAELELDGLALDLVDVPGTYSLSARSREEQVAIDEILGRAGSRMPDLVLLVLNATNLERSLYLLLQVQELGYPVLAAVNMVDEARQQGITMDLPALSQQLDVPMLPVVARSGEGLVELQRRLRSMLLGERPRQRCAWRWDPSEDLRAHLDELVAELDELQPPEAVLSQRRALALWALMSLSAEDDLEGISPSLRERTLRLQEGMQAEGHDLDLEVTAARYQQIDELLDEHVRQDRARADRTRRIDGVLTHPVYGMVVFLAVMAIVFAAIFDWAAPLIDGIDAGVGWFGDRVAAALPDGLLRGIVVDGIIAGVGSVLVFLPQILILFLLVTLLESSGYLARAAFMMDRLMRWLGLSGKAFVPMLGGYACAVPSIMATRTLETRRDRLITMLVLPLTSCSARLPVYVLVISALFPAEQKLLGPVSLGMAMMFGLYVLSTVLALAAAGVLGRFVFKGRSQALLLELPPYRVPPLGQVLRVLWQRAAAFLKTAGTVILVASIVLWAMLEFPKPATYSQDFEQRIALATQADAPELVAELEAERQAEQLQASFAGRLGYALEPLIEPLGFDWKIGIGLIGSVAAREVFVSTLGQVYAVEDADEESGTLRQAMKAQRRADGSLVYSPLTGLSLLVFFMIALQCLSTVAVVRQESGGWKWPLAQLASLTALAYLASLLVYQVGSLLGY